MRRAIFLVACGSLPDGLRLREYAVIALPRPPRPRSVPASFPAWQRAADALDVELSASWLLLGSRAAPMSDEVKTGFQGWLSVSSGTEVVRAAKRLDAAASRSRVIADFETARRRCERLRQAGKRIVFTNGVFDLFHVGHARLLAAARAMGGALVVGINSDDSARSLKGRSRPVVPQFARAEVVAAIRGVDFCVVFGDSDPLELLRVVHPDLLVKGTEYSLAGVVGRRLVESWGGSVRRVSHLTGWSSSGLMKAVRG